jgi:hypothetical protein
LLGFVPRTKAENVQTSSKYGTFSYNISSVKIILRSFRFHRGEAGIPQEELKQDGSISVGNSRKMESRESHIMYLGKRAFSWETILHRFLEFLHSQELLRETQVELANCFGI